MPYHEVTDPFQTAQNVLFEQLRKAGAEKQRAERQAQETQSMHDYLREQVNKYNNGVDPTDNETGYGTEKTNRDVQDSMNEKLADKGISVDNVDTKHVSDETQDMTLANRPTTDDKVQANMNEKLADKGISVDNVDTKHVSDKTQDMTLANRPTTDDKVQANMNDKLNDKGISVDNVNTDPVRNAEHVTMDRTQSKMTTEPKKSAAETNESIKSSMNDKLSDNGVKVGFVNSEAVKGKEVNPVKNVNPPKTEHRRFKDDSGYATITIPNKPVGHIKK